MDAICFTALMKNVKGYINDSNKLEMIFSAFSYASKLHEGQKRQSWEDYISHPLAVAFILSEMSADSDTLCAALLHDTIEDANIIKKKLEVLFNYNVALLVGGQL